MLPNGFSFFTNFYNEMIVCRAALSHGQICAVELPVEAILHTTLRFGKPILTISEIYGILNGENFLFFLRFKK